MANPFYSQQYRTNPARRWIPDNVYSGTYYWGTEADETNIGSGFSRAWLTIIYSGYSVGGRLLISKFLETYSDACGNFERHELNWWPSPDPEHQVSEETVFEWAADLVESPMERLADSLK
jgi:hypothetical protein